MSKKAELKGQIFNRLTVVEKSEYRKGNKVYWLCQCSCGNFVEVETSRLRSGNTKSCGCLRREITGKLNRKHGHSYKNKIRTKTYRSWAGMLQRCNNPNNPNYEYYGGRGIKVCKRWYDFRNFLVDMGKAQKRLSIDRINNDGNYEPGNCRWATNKEQARNSRATKLNPLKVQIIKKMVKESSISMKDIAKIFDVTKETIWHIKTDKTWRDIQYG